MTSRAQPEYLPTNVFFNKAKQAGFPIENLARFLQYTLTASEMNINFVRRIKYQTDPPVQILYAGVLALPIVNGLGITRKMAEDPNTCMSCAYDISHAGTGFGYLPPLDSDLLAYNGMLAQGHYVIWLNAVQKGKEWD